jgi:N-acyl-phosphatidylethanolamine-hydrolysing phospholipase D
MISFRLNRAGLWFILVLMPLTALTIESSDHFREGHFVNPHAEQRHGGFWMFLKWRMGWLEEKDAVVSVPNDFSYPTTREVLDSTRPRVTWVGHDSFLIQIDSHAFVTDPIWSERCSPVSWAGPKRLTPPGLAFEQLPPIQFGVISHNHYDHLDLPTLKRFGSEVVWLVPLGLKKLLKGAGIPNVVELDWWQSQEVLPGIKVTAVPAQHFSSRSFWDRNETLWTGWMIDVETKTQKRRIYFAGDTGYNAETFKEIGSKLGGVDLSLIPIGGYLPRKIMKSMHVNPEEALSIHQDLKSKLSIGMHWNTFRLTDENQNQPPYDLFLAMKKCGEPFDKFLVLTIGETVNF